MAEGGSSEMPCASLTLQAQQMIHGVGNLEYQMEQFVQSGGQEVKILLSGKTGVGKSHLTNALIGEELADVGDDVDPKTDEVTPYKFVKNKVNITVFDTPGLADATGQDEKYLRKIQAKESKFDLFLFCTELNTVRFRNDDMETMKKLTSTLGPQLWDHAIVVLTFANEVRPSPSEKANDVDEITAFNNRFRGFKGKIQQVLSQVGIPENVANNVPFVPAGDLREPILPDRDNWLTAFWVAAFKRINRKAKAAFLLANVHRIAFSYDEDTLANSESKESDAGPPISGMSTEEVQAIKALTQNLQEISFANQLDSCLSKPRMFDENGLKVATAIEMDKTSTQEVFQEMVGGITGNLIVALFGTSFGRHYQTFLGWMLGKLKKISDRPLESRSIVAIKDRPENEEHEECGDEITETQGVTQS